MRRGRGALDTRPPWLLPVARQVLEAYHRPPLDRPRELAAYIELAIDRLPRPAALPAAPQVRRWFVPEPAMGRMPWPVPGLPSVRDLADFLQLGQGDLAWLADARHLERSVPDERLRNYRYAWLPRGDRPARVIESPKQRLKAAQRRVLHEILDRIPAHTSAHGFTRGRSALTNAAEHVSQRVVVRLDLEDFFASIAARRVYGIFRTAGYPEAVAHVLTALTTNVIPTTTWAALPRPREQPQIVAHHRLGRRLATPHLPQGAPTSPALANLAAFGLDRRLGGLATALGATYTRYADDLTFSGGGLLHARAGEIRALVTTIAGEEGFTVNDRKSALMTRAGRQRVCGIVVNERPNVPRDEYDRLRAILHNAARHGPAAENRAGAADFRAHLLGRIGWVESVNPARGAKLRARFARIAWD
ncbi:MAG: reverse transcriptase family protein [Solirubrobacteraceae bacterium]|nr:reverse transcriptase family protein [Solirubrobacteraceae bacterium]